MSNNIKITPAEWEIMEAIWKLGGSPSVRDVLEHAFTEGEKAYTTVQTIMNNLERKGLLRRKKIGLVYFYGPTKSRSAMVEAELSSLIARVFHGSIPALANHLLNAESISMEEIEAIRRLLAQKENELKGK